MQLSPIHLRQLGYRGKAAFDHYGTPPRSTGGYGLREPLPSATAPATVAPRPFPAVSARPFPVPLYPVQSPLYPVHSSLYPVQAFSDPLLVWGCRCRSATLVDTHRVSRPLFRVDVYPEEICAGGGVHEDALSCGRIEGYEFHYILRDIIYDAYTCGTIWDHIKACAIIIYAEEVCGSRKDITSVAGLGDLLKHPLRIL
jgi:hypothetical protein